MKTKHSFWQKSRCLGSWLHRFVIKAEFPQGVLEVCEICHMRRFFRIHEGKVNNKEYMDWHFRQALTPFHPYFNHEYTQ